MFTISCNTKKIVVVHFVRLLHACAFYTVTRFERCVFLFVIADNSWDCDDDDDVEQRTENNELDLPKTTTTTTTTTTTDAVTNRRFRRWKSCCCWRKNTSIYCNRQAFCVCI